DRQLFGLVDLAATAVVAAAWVSLGVLVRQRRAEGGENLRAREVLARDELQSTPQPVQLRDQDPGDVRVEGLQRGEVGAVERLTGAVIHGVVDLSSWASVGVVVGSSISGSAGSSFDGSSADGFSADGSSSGVSCSEGSWSEGSGMVGASAGR